LTGQFIIVSSIVILLAVACFFSTDLLGYQVPALLLLMSVSIAAMLFDIWPVIFMATLSALIWNFFFIPPTFTFHVGTTNDALLLLMYFLVASINVVLMSRIRRFERIARDKQEKQNTVKLYNTLFNSLSHELKTPLATLLVASDTLNHGGNNLSESSKKELLAEIEKSGLRLQYQIENLLNMSRIESGTIKLKKDWCDLNELINHILAKFRETYPNRKIDFEENQNIPLYQLDGGLLEIAIENILLNAILYTPENAEIRIVASGKKEYCEISISDTGPGFPKNEIAFAFDKFHRVDPMKTGGTGLGLSIARGIVEVHQGTITLENITSGGALFKIKIPTASSSLSIFR